MPRGKRSSPESAVPPEGAAISDDEIKVKSGAKVTLIKPVQAGAVEMIQENEVPVADSAPSKPKARPKVGRSSARKAGDAAPGKSTREDSESISVNRKEPAIAAGAAASSETTASPSTPALPPAVAMEADTPAIGTEEGTSPVIPPEPAVLAEPSLAAADTHPEPPQQEMETLEVTQDWNAEPARSSDLKFMLFLALLFVAVNLGLIALFNSSHKTKPAAAPKTVAESPAAPALPDAANEDAARPASSAAVTPPPPSPSSVPASVPASALPLPGEPKLAPAEKPAAAALPTIPPAPPAESPAPVPAPTAASTANPAAGEPAPAAAQDKGNQQELLSIINKD